MSISNPEGKEAVCALLEHAFAGADPPNLPGHKGHKHETKPNEILLETEAEFRRSLLTFEAKSVPIVLRMALTELLNAADREGIEDVVSFLDAEYWHAEGRADMAASHAEHFSLLTPDQAGAIVAWLQHVRTWDELAEHQEQIERAIGYWERRAAQIPPSVHRKDKAKLRR